MEEDDDDIYQNAFDEVSSVMSSIQARELEQKSILSELESYLNEISSKQDSEGNRLVSYPKNFDSIASAMTRKDLENSSEASWSKHLLAQKFDEDISSSFENGRYKDMLDKELKNEKIDRGLAEIHLLDNQLRKLSRKAYDINKSISSTSESSPRLDSTFLTRIKNESLPGSTSQSRAETPRSELVDSPLREEESNEMDVNNRTYEDKDNMKDQNKTLLKKKFTDDEELRILAILHDDYDIQLQSAYHPFQDRIDALDAKIESFGRLDRCNDIENLIPISGGVSIVSKDNKDAKTIGNAYLEQQVNNNNSRNIYIVGE